MNNQTQQGQGQGSAIGGGTKPQYGVKPSQIGEDFRSLDNFVLIGRDQRTGEVRLWTSENERDVADLYRAAAPHVTGMADAG